MFVIEMGTFQNFIADPGAHKKSFEMIKPQVLNYQYLIFIDTHFTVANVCETIQNVYDFAGGKLKSCAKHRSGKSLCGVSRKKIVCSDQCGKLAFSIRTKL